MDTQLVFRQWLSTFHLALDVEAVPDAAAAAGLDLPRVRFRPWTTLDNLVFKQEGHRLVYGCALVAQRAEGDFALAGAGRPAAPSSGADLEAWVAWFETWDFVDLQRFWDAIEATVAVPEDLEGN